MLSGLLPVIFLLVPTLSYAGFCNIAWDGDKLALQSKELSGMRLLDKDNHISAEITTAEIMAFYEAKEAISRVIGKPASFMICEDKEPNAFAGKESKSNIVGVTVGMMKLVNGDRDMAAMVIGHEYAHHVRDHASAGQDRDNFFNIIGIVMGIFFEYKIQSQTGVQDIGLHLGQAGAKLVSRKFSRDQEREADELGFSYMVEAGFNPRGAIRLAERMEKLGSGGAGLFFDSHPGWPERNTQFQSMIARNPSAQRNMIDSLTGPILNSPVDTDTQAFLTRPLPNVELMAQKKQLFDAYDNQIKNRAATSTIEK